MKKAINNIFVALMFAFLIFRVVVAAKAQAGQSFIARPIDINVEIGLSFISFICILLVIKRLKVGGVIYALTFFAYFGVDLYNQLMNLMSGNEVDPNFGMNVVSSAVGIIMGILSLMNIAFYKVKVTKDLKTQWFYTNKELDREKDDKKDHNHYRIM